MGGKRNKFTWASKQKKSWILITPTWISTNFFIFLFQVKGEFRRSLAPDSFNVPATPTTRKTYQPIIVKLNPPTPKPPTQHANLPMRFGRGRNQVNGKTFTTPPNMPQRFGRSWGVIHLSAQYPKGTMEASETSALEPYKNSGECSITEHWFAMVGNCCIENWIFFPQEELINMLFWN